MIRFMNPKPQIRLNYLYFGFFFGLLLLLSTSGILLKDNLVGSRFFFWIYALGQSVLEVMLLVLCGSLLFHYVGKKAFFAFIGFTFVCGILHILDFLMDRILDLSVFYAIRLFVLDEDWANFLYLLDASGVPLWLWALALVIALSIPFLGIALYRGTDWFCQKKTLHWRFDSVALSCVCIPAALFLWDFAGSRVIQPDAYTEFTKSLPWKMTFLRPEAVKINTSPLTPFPSHEEVNQAITAFRGKARKKPNIFLVITESLRSDCIHAGVAPHLSKFRDDNIHATLSLSNANASHISWFSIFHSQFPFAWSDLKSERQGSPALALFKKLGYKIRLYSSAQLGYYGMEELLFGSNAQLLDFSQTFHHAPPKQACTSDCEALAALKKDLREDPSLQEGQFFILFWDGTHFDYSWPKEKGSLFTPFAQELTYFRAFYSKNRIESIKNRYRNAVHHIDTLFGEFLEGLSPESIIVFTGDHGEEFFDHGHLFHNSHLVQQQLSVPLYFKIGMEKKVVPLMSQMDIMPTLLDAVSGITSPLLEGESILRASSPFVVSARFNGKRSPIEFCLQNGRHKMIAQFRGTENVYQARELQILSLRKQDDTIKTEAEIQPWVLQEFGPALERLFPSRVFP
jgi:glucan phosphoethanolaminetransferase (alkaline phosphatase superfamily)